MTKSLWDIEDAVETCVVAAPVVETAVPLPSSQQAKPKAKKGKKRPANEPSENSERNPVGEISRLLRSLCYGRNTWDVFSDWLTMSALTLRNSFDQYGFEEREAEYLKIVGRYKAEELTAFCSALAVASVALQEIDPPDVLGSVFNELELANKWAGQFFSPIDICRCMAAMTFNDATELIGDKPYITVMEPACGGGAMIIAAVSELRKQKIDVAKRVHVTCIDVDMRCVNMCYIQLTLMGVPALVIHGNTLSAEQHSLWPTPAHVAFCWRHRLHYTFGSMFEVPELSDEAKVQMDQVDRIERVISFFREMPEKPEGEPIEERVAV